MAVPVTPRRGVLSPRGRRTFSSSTVKQLYGVVAILALVNLMLTVLQYGSQVEVSMGGMSSARLMDNAISTPAASDFRRREKEQEKQEEPPALDEPLNIMFFYADDWTMKVLGKLNPLVQTPNIDKMADNGILFTNNCVTTSTCWISRATMLTGTYASRHQFLSPHQDTLFRTHPWNETVFPLLKSNGYYTGIVGKWHSPQPKAEMEMAFNSKRCYFGSHWVPRRDGQLHHVTDLNLQDSLEFLQKRPKDKKFALVVSFFATHAWDGHVPTYQNTNETNARYYNDVTIPTPKTNTDSHWKRMPYFFHTKQNAGHRRYRERFDPPNFQENIKGLYRMATHVDEAVGKLIQTLKDQGVYDKTLLIFSTDNGNLHGEHELAEKWVPYEESIRVPLIIVDPRMHKSQHGTRNEEFTLSIDLAPTMLGAAKISPSGFMQGRDMASLYLPKRDSEPVRWRQDWFYEYNRGDPITAEGHQVKDGIDASFALITKEWKYIYWPHHKYEQIFHLSEDPFEEYDVFNRSQIIPTDDVYFKLRARYEVLKSWVQSGNRV